MSILTLRAEVDQRVREFAWRQWGQMGVAVSVDQRDGWAIDPEALLLFTFEIGRDDPRLFDEVLDWLVGNAQLISVQRLRNLAHDDADRALTDAVLAWLSRLRPRTRLVAKPVQDRRAADDARPLFRAAGAPTQEPDAAFLAHGLVKPRVEPSGNSQQPALTLPVNFAFRLRQLLGVGARAEVVRILLGMDTARVSAQVVAKSAVYAKRNVYEALTSLTAAGVVDLATSVGNQQQFSVPRERWAALFDLPLDALPRHRDWPALLHALRIIVRWLADPQTEQLSDYMRASDARQLIESITPELSFAGVPIVDRGAHGAEYWDDFVATVRAGLDGLSQ